MNDEFRREYPTTPNALLAARYGVSTVTILGWARRFGLSKDPEYRRGVQRSNASKRRLTVEQREHLSQRARGRRVSPETIAKAMETKRRHGTILRGSRHPFWKGGRPWERFRDPAYVRWGNAVLARDEYRCRNWPAANGLTLCRRCHMALHGRSPRPIALIPCACGCGTLIPERDIYGRARRYVNHHARRRNRSSPEASAPSS
jgi:hypothetical protein